MTFQETTTPLLRPAQAQEWKEQAKTLRQMLSAPPHIANRIEDRGQMTKNLKALERDLKSQEPRPYDVSELDSAVSRSDQLKGEILEGMPTQAEMRRNPAGAVDKHRRWEKRNKKKLNEWKNIQLRRHQTGDVDLADATDVANFERFRPSGGSQQLNMHNEQIPGTAFHLPPPNAAPVTVFTDEDIAAVKAADPGINLAALNNEQRATVKQWLNIKQTIAAMDAPATAPMEQTAVTTLRTVGDVVVVVPKKTRKKRDWTDEERAAFGAKMKAARAKKQEG